MFAARSCGRILRTAGAMALVPFVALVPAAPSSRRPPASITFVAVGDICLAGGVERAAARSGKGYPFERMSATLKGADVAFGNLECALTDHKVAIPKRYNFRASPTWAPRLAKAGFDALSLANNHSMDFGREGLRDTVASLRKSGVLPVGAGDTLAEAHAVHVVVRKGIRIGLLAYLGMYPPLLPIVPDRPAVAMAGEEAFRRDIAAARKRADVILVSLHAGKEMVTEPSWRQKALARAAIDAGADAVIGHHPHVVQPIEMRRGKPIFYSLGNFVFNPSPSFLRNPNGPWSAMARMEITKDGVRKADLVRLRIVNRQPRQASVPHPHRSHPSHTSHRAPATNR